MSYIKPELKRIYPNFTTFIIPSINRPTLARAMDSVLEAGGIYSVCIDKDKQGAGSTRNRLIGEAKTEWVSFVDDDDSICPDYLERLQEEIEAHPEVDVIHFRQYLLRGHLLPSWPEVEFGNIGISFSVKRDVALKYPFKSEPHEDYEFIKRLKEAGKSIHFSKYMVYRVRH